MTWDRLDDIDLDLAERTAMTPPRPSREATEPRTAAGRILLHEHSSGTPHMARHIAAIEAEKDAEYEKVVDLYRKQRDEAEAAGAPLREALEAIVASDHDNESTNGQVRDRIVTIARAALTATPASLERSDPAPLDVEALQAALLEHGCHADCADVVAVKYAKHQMLTARAAARTDVLDSSSTE